MRSTVPSESVSSPEAETVRAGLEQLRLRLLDLTSKNRLISFRHTNSTIRAVDANLDKVHSVLVAGDKLPFLYLPEPTKEEIAQFGEKPTPRRYAEALGWDISFDLPRGSGRADVLPVLHYKEDFETLIRKVGTTAKTALEESGVNLLHLVFGFLEWRESDDSTQLRHAPLIVVPVSLFTPKAREEDRAIKLQYTGEDLTTNLSLVEKMRRDFGIDIPVLQDEETPEQYFGRFREILEHKRDWRICRQVSLGLLSFGKLLMYLDLDVDRWPKSSPLATHPRLTDILTGSGANGLAFASEYDLDEEALSNYVPPIICDADSSQHSALIDAARGKNLVIEGPPGTGKSQTITNLIAAFLSQGKRVLFVAEKMAALNVVKRRLDDARLGDFCLELHSHKTSKVGLLKSLDARIVAHRTYTEQTVLTQQSGLLKGHREALTKYVNLLNKPFARIEQSPFEMIWHRDELRLGLNRDLLQLNSLVFPQSHEWDFADVAHRRDGCATLQAHLLRFRDAGGSTDDAKNPWSWLASGDLELSQQQHLLSILSELKRLYERQCSLIERFRNAFAGVTSQPDSWLPAVDTWASAIPEHSSDSDSSLYRSLEEPRAAKVIHDFISSLSSYFLRQSGLPGRDLLLDSDLPEQAVRVMDTLGASGVESFTLTRLRKIVETITEAKERSIPAENAVRELGDALGVQAAFSLRCLADLHTGRVLLDAAPIGLLHLRHTKFASEGLLPKLRQAQAECESLLSEQSALSEDFVLISDTTATELHNAAVVLESTPWFARWFSSKYRAAQGQFQAVCRNEGKKTNHQMATGLRYIAQIKRRVSEFFERQSLQLQLGDDFKGLETSWIDLVAVATWYEELSIKLPEHVTFAREVRKSLLELPAARLRGILHSPASEVPKTDELQRLSVSLKTLHGLLPRLAFEWSNSKIDEFLHSAFSVAEQARMLLDIVSPLDLSPSTTDTELRSIFAEAVQLRHARSSLNENAVARDILGPAFQGISSSRSILESTLLFVERVQQTTLPTDLMHWLLSDKCEERIHWIGEWLREFDLNRASLSIAEKRLAEVLKGDFSFGDRLSYSELEQARALLNACLQSSNLLSMWVDVRLATHRLRELGLQYLVDAVTSHGLPIEQLRAGFDYLFYDSLVRKVFNDNPDLWKLTGTGQEETRKRFVDLDKAVIELTQLEIAYRASRARVPQGIRGAVVRETTELALVQHEISKQKQHIPIRQLLLRAGEAIQALKPCFMMSPMSVAQFLAPGLIQFDLVVMDEASQLRPEDALGVIARGTQLVVVGDPKQLPPTSFFQRALADEEDATEKTIAAEGESILDIALGRYQPVRRLRWHYRSQHHSLIAFSNQEFYDGDLVVFPSAYHEHPDLGVKFVPVQGTFENRRNALEAQRVVEAVLEHIAIYPGDSLGVVTMNFEQRELIEELLDAHLAHDSFSSTWIEGREDTPEPFFIKNLENVQGDERDAIFISVTYGKDAQGSMFQRFSGVNSASGQRRLNVLITRAKKRTVVFSSLDGDQIQVGPSTPWGVRALKGYLDYAKKGISSQPVLSPGAEPANEHEAAIGYVLKQHGYEVVPQVGVSGYFIDLAVRHPEKPGVFLLGIEFDGKSYHSGRSARDRDRLRQMTLEKQGWKIHRIWSTDWFKNREAEVNRLLKRVRTLESVQDAR